MMMQQMNINSSAPITTSAGILNLDHYKYLRSLLPSVPHFIESLSFTDLNNWECEIYVSLLTESDCMKWLTDFQETTKTDWKVDKATSRQSHWMMVYRCIPSDSKKECTAKLEMKILGQGENERMNKHGKQYPCLITVHFYHNHMATSTNTVSMESFKSQDIPSHLKEGFEGYFQETMQPGNNLGQPTTVNINAIKPHHNLHQTPISHSVSNVVIKSEPIISPLGQHQHMDGKLERTNHEIFDLSDVSRKLDMTLDVLRIMLKQTGTACASVKQFVDKFERLKGDQTQLEDALTSFGSQWDWLVTGANEASPQPPPPLSPASVGSAESPKKKSKKKKKADSPQQVFSTNIVGGQIVLQPQAPVVEQTDAKRRKRARCGSCSGCLNRDKTQDCRQCRNCMDQKRYGGPGRLKKACIKRQCVVISQMIAAELAGGDRKSPSASVPHLVKTESVAQVLATQQPIPVSHALATQQPLPVSHTLATPQHIPVTHQVTMVTSQGANSRVQHSAATTIPASTLLSWPGTHYAQTFQVQQPVQFAFQPQPYPGAPAQIQYATSQIQHLGTSQLENIASEAARHHGVG